MRRPNILGLAEYIDKKPRALSGGQRQRVAMGRAIVREPQAFLMDEPLSNLDAKLRVQTRSEIARIQRNLGVTTIYVTHDQVEAMTMGDRVAVIRKGVLQQVDPPQTLYDKPVNLFVAGFIGSPAMNLADANLARSNGTLTVRFGEHSLAVDERALEQRPSLAAHEGKPVIVGIRPEDIEDAALESGAPADRRLKVEVDLREALGSDVVAHFGSGVPPVVTQDTKELMADVAHDAVDAVETVERVGLHRPARRGDTRRRRRAGRARGRHAEAPLLRSRDRPRDLLIAHGGNRTRRNDEETHNRVGTRRPGRVTCDRRSRMRRRRRRSSGADGELGGTVTILGAFGGDEEKLFNESVADFEEETGIDVQYTSTNDLPTLIRSRVSGNNPPDIALFPQPGLVLDLAEQGAIVPLEETIDLEAVRETVIPGFLESATFEEEVYGVPMRMAVKSLVWYPVPEFEDGGYEVPETSTALAELSDTIKSDGGTPWCIGYESGQATGWVGTDWMEEFVLRTGGPEVYDRWVTHELPFNSPEIKAAAAEYEKLAFRDGQVVGGREAIISTPFGDSPNPMFNDDAGLLPAPAGELHHRVLPRPRPAGSGGERRRLLLPAGRRRVRREAAARRWRHRDDLRGLRGQRVGRRDARVHGLRQVRRPVGRRRWLALAVQDVRQLAVLGRDHEADRRSRGRRGRVPLRRVRPDAGSRRRRDVLARDDRVDER